MEAFFLSRPPKEQLPQKWKWILLPSGLWGLQIDGFRNPIFIDFDTPVQRRRSQAATRYQEPLARAVGITKTRALRVLDLTAGWGRDAIFLARLGACVTLVEKHPILGYLLKQALIQVELESWAQNVTCCLEDGVSFLMQCQNHFDVIYLDPMFNTAFKRSARVNKESWILRALNPLENTLWEANERLLKAALESRVNRVVLKQPLHAKQTGKKPTFSISSGPCRLDVFQLS